MRALSADSARIFSILTLIDVPLDAVDDHFQRNEILAALQNNQIGVLFAWLHKLLMHGLDRGKVLVQDGLQASSALCD